MGTSALSFPSKVQCEGMFLVNQKAGKMKAHSLFIKAPITKAAHALVPESALFLCIRNPAQAIQIKTK